MKYYPAAKSNEIWSEWVEQGHILLSVTQTRKDNHHILSHICVSLVVNIQLGITIETGK